MNGPIFYPAIYNKQEQTLPVTFNYFAYFIFILILLYVFILGVYADVQYYYKWIMERNSAWRNKFNTVNLFIIVVLSLILV